MNERDAELRSAAYNNRLSRTKALLKLGANPNATDEKGQTALHAAVAWFQPNVDVIWRSGTEPEVLEALLEGGALLNPRDKEGVTPLLLACRNDNESAAQFLIHRGADVKPTDAFGWSALTWHLWHWRRSDSLDRRSLVKLLRSRGAVLTLWDALFLNDTRLAERLVENAPTKTRGALGRTLLHLAAQRGLLLVTERLLVRGAEVGALDEKKRTALHYALGGDSYVSQTGETRWEKYGTQKGRERLVALLLRAGARVTAHEGWFEPEDMPFGQTPLEWAVGFQRPELMRLLLKAGADANQRVRGEDPILFDAILIKNAEVVKVLLEAGADPTVKSTVGNWDALSLAERLPRIQRLLREALKKRQP